MVHFASRFTFVSSLIFAASLSVAAPVSLSDLGVRAPESQPAQESLFARFFGRNVQFARDSDLLAELPLLTAVPFTADQSQLLGGLVAPPIASSSVTPTGISSESISSASSSLPTTSSGFSSDSVSLASSSSLGSPTSLSGSASSASSIPSDSPSLSKRADVAAASISPLPPTGVVLTAPSFTAGQVITVYVGSPSHVPISSSTPTVTIISSPIVPTGKAAGANPITTVTTVTVTTLAVQNTPPPAVGTALSRGINPSAATPVTIVVQPPATSTLKVPIPTATAKGAPNPNPAASQPPRTRTVFVPAPTSSPAKSPSGTIAAPAMITIAGLQKPAHIEAQFSFDISKRDGWSGRGSRIFGRKMPV